MLLPNQSISSKPKRIKYVHPQEPVKHLRHPCDQDHDGDAVLNAFIPTFQRQISNIPEYEINVDQGKKFKNKEIQKNILKLSKLG